MIKIIHHGSALGREVMLIQSSKLLEESIILNHAEKETGSSWGLARWVNREDGVYRMRINPHLGGNFQWMYLLARK